MKDLTIYLSGPISSAPDFKANFASAEKFLLRFNPRRILNPTIFPPGWDYHEYMAHCMLMVQHADVIVTLDMAAHSPGSRAEVAYAHSLKKQVRTLAEFHLLQT